MSYLLNVDFIGPVEWCLSTHFVWLQTPDETTVRINESGILRYLVK